jgi:hypothetical protein
MGRQPRLLLALSLVLAAAWAQQPDRPPRSLVVILRDDSPALTESITGTAEATARAGSVVLSTGRPLQADPHGNAQVLSTQAGGRSATILEGEPFRISMPASQSVWVGVHGGGAGPKNAAPGSAAGGRASARPDAAGVVHFDAVSDFTARIWLDGTAVAIELQPLAQGRIDSGTDPSPGKATVYGRVGQWIELAESGSAASGGSGAPPAGLWIKVEPAAAGR